VRQNEYTAEPLDRLAEFLDDPLITLERSLEERKLLIDWPT
jgi:hypothetical protein